MVTEIPNTASCACGAKLSYMKGDVQIGTFVTSRKEKYPTNGGYTCEERMVTTSSDGRFVSCPLCGGRVLL